MSWRSIRSMRPEAAASQLAAMDDTVAAAILAKLNARAAGADPERDGRGESRPPDQCHVGAAACGTQRKEVMTMRILLAALCLASLGGCGTDIRDIGREPHMSPVGTGLQVYTPPATDGMFRASIPSHNGSLFTQRQRQSVRDLRASRVGDVLTVTISMDEKATLGNTTDRTPGFEGVDRLRFPLRLEEATPRRAMRTSTPTRPPPRTARARSTAPRRSSSRSRRSSPRCCRTAT